MDGRRGVRGDSANATTRTRTRATRQVSLLYFYLHTVLGAGEGPHACAPSPPCLFTSAARRPANGESRDAALLTSGGGPGAATTSRGRGPRAPPEGTTAAIYIRMAPETETLTDGVGRGCSTSALRYTVAGTDPACRAASSSREAAMRATLRPSAGHIASAILPGSVGVNRMRAPTALSQRRNSDSLRGELSSMLTVFKVDLRTYCQIVEPRKRFRMPSKPRHKVEFDEMFDDKHQNQ
ncbi:hypothetical protein EVAR_16080_1 [Eumeta japonica]|uniref:Uncharacterized protein n=1 Tax=Eumeta variegata TaxID=151549 RepID=A0A4C1UIS3_EUMVA|nr:hypothetical protein EVAR_16080_1 [Eumeta japonica]